MTAYIGMLEREVGTLWGIWFPDLPGCVAAGDTSEAVLDQAGDAMAQWIACAEEDGTSVRSARSMEELRLDPDVRDAIDKGDVPVLVTLPEQPLGLGADALRAIDAAAARRGVSRLDFLRQAVLDKLAS